MLRGILERQQEFYQEADSRKAKGSGTGSHHFGITSILIEIERVRQTINHAIETAA